MGSKMRVVVIGSMIGSGSALSRALRLLANNIDVVSAVTSNERDFLIDRLRCIPEPADQYHAGIGRRRNKSDRKRSRADRWR